MQVDPTAFRRFRDKIQPTPSGCWVWTAETTEKGHGKFWLCSRKWRAHRVSWLIYNGNIPPGLQVLHNCPNGDNPSCVNPDHLYLGTHADNMEDKAAKGQAARGARNGMSQLTALEVRSLRELRSQGMTLERLGRLFRVSTSTAWRVTSGDGWKHIDQTPCGAGSDRGAVL